MSGFEALRKPAGDKIARPTVCRDFGVVVVA